MKKISEIFNLRRILLSLAIVIFVLLIPVIFHPLFPTRSDWLLFPKSNEYCFVQNHLFWNLGRTYGDKRMYSALESTIKSMQKKYPGIRYAYMDISGRNGFRLFPHLSHRKGIDIDIQYWGIKQNGKTFPLKTSFWNIGYSDKYDKDQSAGKLKYDAEKNWDFLICLKNNGIMKARRIYVEPYIKLWLIEEGIRQGASKEEIDWAKSVLGYAGDKAADHKDHFHIRF